jgi:hypothetical protein
MAYNLQSVAESQTSRFSVSAASQQVSKNQNVYNRHSGQPRRRAPPIDRGPEEFEYHFHETPLGLSESYFADSQQHHCTFASRNNAGLVLLEGSETSDSDSSDDDGAISVQRQKKVRLEGSLSIKTTEEDIEKDIKDAATGVRTQKKARLGRSLSIEATENDIEEDKEEDNEKFVQSSKLPYIPDDDLFKERWFPDPWDRPLGQMWTNPVQDQHNLRAAINERGFTGARAAWVFSELQKRKGTRFPYMERTSVLKKSEQTHMEYLRALKRRKDEKLARENQVKEYDEEGAPEEIKWTLRLYDMVYGPDPPNDAAKTDTNTPEIALDRNGTDDMTEKEPPAKRRKIAQQTPDTGRSRRMIVSNVVNGISDPGPDQKASQQEVEESNREFNAHKAKVLEAARKEREEVDLRAFIYSTQNRNFSHGYRESCK